MPYKEPKIEKMFYSIGEVAEMFGENTSLIRFWANRFTGMINPHKNKKGNRMFTPEDIETFKIIYHLVKEKGMTLDGARKRLEENRDGEDKNVEVIQSLENIKQLLLEVKELL
jgi:DNA-binding transcriptional MerR regulator